AVGALGALAIISPAAAAPSTDDARARIRALEQRVIEAGRAIPAARSAEARAAARARAADRRLRSATQRLRARTRAQRAGQVVLATRLRDLYRRGSDDPLVAVLVSGSSLAALAGERADAERAAREDARLVARLRADRRAVGRLQARRAQEARAAADARNQAAERRAAAVALRDGRARALRAARTQLRRLEAREAARARQRARATQPGGTTAGTPRGGRWPAVPGGPSRAVLERIAWCESRGNPRSIGGGGQFRGKYQFMQSTWEAMGGSGDPAAASEAEQDYRAALLFVKWGPGQWPVCAAFAR
ncbi:MAG: transglycosylase family protein, partial [Thermoleophilia bacterium]